MAHVVAERDTTASPERVLGVLTDFSPRRFDLWPSVDRSAFEYRNTGASTAEVREQSPGLASAVWELGRYDWSRPGQVRIDIVDSNAFKPGSFWVYDVTPGPNGGSHVRMEFDRRPRNLKGLFVGALLSLFGKKLYSAQLGETLRRIETSTTS